MASAERSSIGGAAVAAASLALLAQLLAAAAVCAAPRGRQGVPPCGRLAGVRVGWDTVYDLERRLGPGLAVTGAHPQGARVWHDRSSGWFLTADGFHYR